ncbi:MAG: gluconokinase [Burkholderiales bacterium]|nr:gluconokinase [Burkholderiales bacterium]
MTRHVVVMGVAGCGKSVVGEQLAGRLGVGWIDGDGFHPEENVRKMRRGIALTDEDRAGWLQRLGAEMAAQPAGAVLACSALKRAYRDTLRAAVPGLRFVHLALGLDEAQQRVAAREGHFYPPSLVASQFVTLEDPAPEAGVVVVDAALPVAEVVARAAAELQATGI